MLNKSNIYVNIQPGKHRFKRKLFSKKDMMAYCGSKIKTLKKFLILVRSSLAFF